MQIENEIPGITQEDIHSYDQWMSATQKRWEKENPGQVFKARYNKKLLREFVQGRMDSEDEEAREIGNFMKGINQQAKEKLDVRLAAGEISVEEYQKVIRTLVWSNGQKRNQHTIAGKDELFRKHLDSIGKRDPRIGRAEEAIAQQQYQEIDPADADTEQKYRNQDVVIGEVSEENKAMIERRIEGLKKQDSSVAREELAELLGEKEGPQRPPEEAEESEDGGRLEVPDDLEAKAEEIIRLNGIASKEAREKVREDIEKTVFSEELDAMVFKSGLVLSEYLEPKWMELSLKPEARALLSNLRKMYRSLNQGCGCTRKQRTAIVEQGYKKSILELANKIGLIDAVKEASGKGKVIFLSDGEKFLEG